MMRRLHYLIFIFLFSCGSKNTSTQPVAGSITESVYASGRVNALHQYTAYPTVNGILKKINVQAGGTVARGQVIFEIENVITSLNTENARLALDLSNENNTRGSDKFQELEMNVKLALDKLHLDSSLYVRQKGLWEQNIGTRNDFDQRELAYKNSKANYLLAKNKFAQTKTQLENELRRAKVNYSITEKSQNDFLIKSEVNGKVFDVLKEDGELITPQTALAVIGDADSFLLELEVDERDITRIQPGQQVIVNMDSYTGLAIEATISKVYPIMNERQRTFRLEAVFVNPPARLYPNLSAEANIVIQTKKNAITIPKEYLYDNKYVLVNKTEKRAVTIGLQDYKKVEITSGLTTGDIIYLKK